MKQVRFSCVCRQALCSEKKCSKGRDKVLKKRNMLLRLALVILVFVIGLTSTAVTLQANENSGTVPDTGLRFWRWEGGGISFELVQRLPDQTRAFFQGRGFDAKAADAIGLGCVFQTIFRNTGSMGTAAVEYNLAQWQVIANGRSGAMKLKEEWDADWEASGLSKTSRIAFHWSFLPTRQRFEPGDYNWGMTSYGLGPGTQFDLVLRWTWGDTQQTGRISNIECARDI